MIGDLQNSTDISIKGNWTALGLSLLFVLLVPLIPLAPVIFQDNSVTMHELNLIMALYSFSLGSNTKYGFMYSLYLTIGIIGLALGISNHFENYKIDPETMQKILESEPKFKSLFDLYHTGKFQIIILLFIFHLPERIVRHIGKGEDFFSFITNNKK
jgi:hypothetical protein